MNEIEKEQVTFLHYLSDLWETLGEERFFELKFWLPWRKDFYHEFWVIAEKDL